MPNEPQTEDVTEDVTVKSEPEASNESGPERSEGSGEPEATAVAEASDASRDGEHESGHGKDLRLAAYEALKPVLAEAIETIERGGPPSVDVRHALDNFLDALRNVAVRDRA